MPRFPIILITSAVALSAGIFLTWPEYQLFNNLSEELRSSRAELATKTEYYAQIKNLAAELDQYQDQLAKVSSALPQEQSLPSLLNYLENTASQTGLVLEDIEAAESINLKLSGNYASLKNFIKAIEGSARLFQITRIGILTPTKSKSAFSFNLDITAPWQ